MGGMEVRFDPDVVLHVKKGNSPFTESNQQ